MAAKTPFLLHSKPYQELTQYKCTTAFCNQTFSPMVAAADCRCYIGGGPETERKSLVELRDRVRQEFPLRVGKILFTNSMKPQQFKGNRIVPISYKLMDSQNYTPKS